MAEGSQTIETLTYQLNELKSQMRNGHLRLERVLTQILEEQKHTNGRVTGIETREAAAKAVQAYATTLGDHRTNWVQWSISLAIGLLGALLALWIHH